MLNNKISDDYKKLILKFCENEELVNLLKECYQDDLRLRNNFYWDHNVYPEKTNLIKKLLIDLETSKNYLKEVKNGRSRND